VQDWPRDHLLQLRGEQQRHQQREQRDRGQDPEVALQARLELARVREQVDDADVAAVRSDSG
jgi:hypothetical protein